MRILIAITALSAFVGCVATPDGRQSNARTNQTPQPANLASALVGIWAFPEPEPGISPIVLTLKANATYERETEAAVFERGSWSIIGNEVRLSPAKGTPSTYPVKILSKDKAVWSGDIPITRIHRSNPSS
jgi:hypothetical protein